MAKDNLDTVYKNNHVLLEERIGDKLIYKATAWKNQADLISDPSQFLTNTDKMTSAYINKNGKFIIGTSSSSSSSTRSAYVFDSSGQLLHTYNDTSGLLINAVIFNDTDAYITDNGNLYDFNITPNTYEGYVGTPAKNMLFDSKGNLFYLSTSLDFSIYYLPKDAISNRKSYQQIDVSPVLGRYTTNYVESIAIGSDDTVYVMNTGHDTIASWSIGGDVKKLFNFSIQGSSAHFTVDAFDFIYIGGIQTITKYDKKGNVIWSIPTSKLGSGLGTTQSMTTDAKGNLYTVNLLTSTSVQISKINSDGSLIWTKQVTSSKASSFGAISVDDNYNVYLPVMNDAIYKYQQKKVVS